MMKARSHSAASVSIHVRDLSQMFSSLDPAPFWDRDLDHNAAAFIEDEFSDKRGDRRAHHARNSRAERLGVLSEQP
jgi:hypothetical protein